ncbi:MAG TPA: hypothetical protein VMI53_03730 [Opitutaceae bacterium]|nr:hypothetical protein [Opitutaceae bacterium]
MQTEAIVIALLSAAQFLKKPIQDVTALPLKDAYAAAKAHLLKKFEGNSAAGEALELALSKPESAARKALLIEETGAIELESDAELARLIARLTELLPENAGARQNVRVTGRNNRVQVAAHDIINTERHVRRSLITPDERHIDGAQKKKLQAVIADLAGRLAGEDGRPRFGAVHSMVQRKFKVSAFALIPKEKYDDVRNFLNQQRAIHRCHLRHRNPAAYQQDYFRGIQARSNELGWDKPKLRQFAVEKLGLKRPLVSLRELGAIQLKSLLELVRHESAQSAVKASNG